MVVCGTLCALAIRTAAAQEPQPWWEVCNELPPSQIEACFYEHNGEKEPDGKERTPTSPVVPVRVYIRHRFRSPHSIFVNCPKADASEGDSLICEFRLVSKGRIVKGHAAVLAEAGRLSHTAWELKAFHAERPLPPGRHRCSPPPHRISPGAVSLVVAGIACREAQDRAWRAESVALTASNLRLPRHFLDGDPHTDTIGFEVTSYQCRGTTIVRPPVAEGDDPFGELTARCRNRFDDRFTYVFVIGN
jgi:hypothetical protein